MFVYYFVHLPAPFGEAERLVLGMMGGLDRFAESAYRDGEALHARMSVSERRPNLAKTVRIDISPPLRGDFETTLPLAWEATGTPELFPRMDADLVIAAVGADMTQLSLRGTYRTPLGKVGRALDRALLHRIAESSVKVFVDQIATSVTESLLVSAEGGAR